MKPKSINQKFIFNNNGAVVEADSAFKLKTYTEYPNLWTPVADSINVETKPPKVKVMTNVSSDVDRVQLESISSIDSGKEAETVDESTVVDINETIQVEAPVVPHRRGRRGKTK